MRRYLFVDYGCLRETLRRWSDRYVPGRALVFQESVFAQEFSKIFVYDALPIQDRGEDNAAYQARIEERMANVRRIRAMDGFHMPMGDLRGRKATQKKVDVMMTVDMLLHTIRGNMDHCTLMTGDSDFQPLLEALMREGMETSLWHPEQAPDDLKASADRTRPLDIPSLQNGLRLPDGRWFAPAFQNDLAPAEMDDIVGERDEGGYTYAVGRRENHWRIRRTKLGNINCLWGHDPDLRILLRAAEDIHNFVVPAEAEALLEREGARCLKSVPISNGGGAS